MKKESELRRLARGAATAGVRCPTRSPPRSWPNRCISLTKIAVRPLPNGTGAEQGDTSSSSNGEFEDYEQVGGVLATLGRASFIGSSARKNVGWPRARRDVW